MGSGGPGWRPPGPLGLVMDSINIIKAAPCKIRAMAFDPHRFRAGVFDAAGLITCADARHGGERGACMPIGWEISPQVSESGALVGRLASRARAVLLW